MFAARKLPATPSKPTPTPLSIPKQTSNITHHKYTPKCYVFCANVCATLESEVIPPPPPVKGVSMHANKGGHYQHNKGHSDVVDNQQFDGEYNIVIVIIICYALF